MGKKKNQFCIVLAHKQNRFFFFHRLEYDIFECADIPDMKTTIQVIIEFTSHYIIEEEASLVVWEFSGTDELLKKGLLFYFGDGDDESWYQEIGV